MKIATFVKDGGTAETGEFLAIVNKEEACLLIEMAEAFVRTNPRRKRAKRLLQDMGNLPCF